MYQYTGNLTLEQKFQLKVLEESIGFLTLEEAQNHLLEVFRQMMVKDNLIKHLIRTEK
jgi:hypothetical protein